MISKNEKTIKINRFTVKSDRNLKNSPPIMLTFFFYFHWEEGKYQRFWVINQIIFAKLTQHTLYIENQNMLELQIMMLHFFVILMLK